MALSPRYYRIANEVLRRLPAGWQADHVLRLEESRETVHLPQGRPAVACSARLQFKSQHAWIVILYTSCLDTLSDEAVRWILACELGRVVSDGAWDVKLTGINMPDERVDANAMKWGFAHERRRFEEEYLLPLAS